MAARVARLPGTGVETIPPPAREVLREERAARVVPLPFPAPLLEPRAIEALLLAFGRSMRTARDQ